jgi:hypothetical protein
LSFSKPRIIVTGYAGCVPVGGVAWDYLQYVVGLSRLGFDVYYHEDTFKWPYSPVKQALIQDGKYSARFIGNFFKRYAPLLSDSWHYLHLREKSFGMTRDKFDEIARTADLFLNISGSAAIPENLSSNCKKIFIDTDPGYNQIKMAQKKETTLRMPGFLRVHDLYFTYAENIGSEDCLVPTLDVVWKKTRMPVVLDLWRPSTRNLPVKGTPWTTVMTWSQFKDELVYRGVQYYGKGPEFEKIIALPQNVEVPFKIAVGGVHVPTESLIQNGWNVVEGPSATRTPNKYQQFLAASRGEISVAKNVYAALRTGWFSCRSACYLAAGRPVVVQNTRFDKALPTGKGILQFDTLNEAVRAIREVESNYEHHVNAAQEIANEYFDSDKVLNRLVQDVITGSS